MHLPQTQPQKLLAKGERITLHAQTAFDGRVRKRLLRMLQYMLRPPFAVDAIASPNPNTVRVYLNAPRENGAAFLDMTPFAFLKNLAGSFHRPAYTCAAAPVSSATLITCVRRFATSVHLHKPKTCESPLFELKRQIKGEPSYRPAKPVKPEDDPPRPNRMSWARLLTRIVKIDIKANLLRWDTRFQA